MSAALHSPDASALTAGLDAVDAARVRDALGFAAGLYEGRQVGTGEPALEHALGLAGGIVQLRLDADTRVAGLLFAAPSYAPGGEKAGAESVQAMLKERFGAAPAALVAGITRLNSLRAITRSASGGMRAGSKDAASQAEVLRKMLLAMVEDIRVVLLRLASRVQTLRYLVDVPDGDRVAIARETLDIYAPLANRLGVWQLKWELEDLSFRFIEPQAYRRIAAMLDERRTERETYIAAAVADLRRELQGAGLKADITGRPKHIYSIWNKMRKKSLAFSDLYDVRALRVLVDEVKDCYTALGVVHNLWQPIPREFDDYISRPKDNAYRSLHTAVVGPDGRALEVQIRTHEMHRDAELGVAAHWRYKEGGGRGIARQSGFDDRIAFLRQMLAWRDEVVDASDWAAQSQQAGLDDTIYVLTPQGRVLDLAQGATPVDFAYALHTDVGHRCRGAKVDGRIVPLDYRLQNGEQVEILTAKTGGPSRDWLNPALGYIASSRARNKARQWFNSQALEQLVAAGRATVERELQRLGRTGANLDALAQSLGFARPEELFAAAGREEVGSRQLQLALGGETAAPAPAPAGVIPRKSRAGGEGGILVVGVDRLMTQLSRCCKPVPPDAITGFVTRGRGVAVHRQSCPSLANLAARLPERIIAAQWGEQGDRVYSVDIVVLAADRPGLLKDISEELSREHINVTAVKTLSRGQQASMGFTLEVKDTGQLARTLAMIKNVPGVASASRR